MAESIRHKWIKDLEDVLQCPICFERPKDQIFQCNEGHHICDGCRRKLTVCPFCNGRWSRTRNRLAESLCQKLDVMKLSPTEPEGETNKLLMQNGSTARNGIGACASVPRKAPRRPQGRYPCCMTSCSSFLYHAPLMKHISTEHRDQFLELESSAGVIEYTQTFNTQHQIMFERAFHDAGMGTFFFQLSSSYGYGEGDEWTASVSMIHKPEIARQFMYDIRMNRTRHRGDQLIWSWRDEVSSCRDFRNPSTRQSVVALPAEIRAAVRGEMVECNLRIQKKA